MANCNKLFLDFNKSITPSQEQMGKMKISRKTLERKISEKLQEKLGMTVTFYTQGSGAPKMKTIIIKADGTYDADRGVYLPQEPDVCADTVQRYVLEAVNDHTADGAEHRRKCIRVLYKAAYNIDFPVYYEVPGQAYSYLAIKGNGWIKDSPWEMIEWFEKRKDADCQLLRIVKYLKAWASEQCKQHKMPSGIALTVWAANNFTSVKDRDDEALLKTLKSLQQQLFFTVSCSSPVEPFDDLVAKLDSGQREKFKKALDAFSSDARKAVDEKNQLKASKLWQKHFGSRFQDGVDEEVDLRASALLGAAGLVLNGRAKLDEVGQINSHTGIRHQPHRNYGS
jgi:hypothetical protein